MSLRDTWKNKTDDVDNVLAEDINSIAKAVIELEEENEIDKAPYIGDNGNWFEWDSQTNVFVDTGIKANGYTPVKGTDYWTEEDKTEIVNDVLQALPTAEGVEF